MGLGLGLGIQFNSLGGMVSKILTWGKSIPARFWGTETPEYWGGLDAQAEAHYNRVIADGGVVPAGLGGVNSFFQVVKGVYGTSDINTAISAAYDPHYLGYRLGAGSGTTLGQAAQKLYAPKGIFGGIGTGSAFYDSVGVAGNFVSTPSIGIDTNSGMSVDVKVALVSGVPYTSNWICSNDNGSTNRNMFLGFTSPNRTLIIYWSNLTRFASSTIALSDGFDGWIRCSLETSGSDMLVRFFTSLDGITYTQLGATVTNSGGANTFQTSNAPFNITGNGGVNTIIGKIYRVIYRNASGVVRADFNANQYTGANTWTSTTGEVWTVNSTGAGLADVTQTTAASQPLLLAHTGENYWWGSGVANNFVSTPNAAANRITGDFEVIIKMQNQPITTAYTTLFSSYSAGAGFNLIMDGSGFLLSEFNLVGSGYTSVTSSVSLTTSFNGYLKMTRVVSTGQVRFFTSNNGITYTQLGTTLSTPTNNIIASTAPFNIGRYIGTPFEFVGKIYRLTLATSIDGTPVVDFNPSSYNPSVSQTQWSSATGEVWTINTDTATTGFKGAIVDRSIVQGNGINMFMTVPNSTAMFNFMHNGTGGTAYYVSRRFQTASSEYGIMATNSGSALNGFYITDNINNISYYTAKTSVPVAVLSAQTTTTTSLAMYIAQYRDQAGNDAFTGRNNVLGAGVAQTSTPTTADAAQNLAFMAFSITGSGSANMNFTSVLLVRNMDNSTQQTAMYNALKSYNNGAF